jgi:ElaB/YqjD/DUF883 family membrane-anchored ribosome-binding protein
LSTADAVPELPNVDDLRKQLVALKDQINDLTGAGLGKAAAQIRDRPLPAVLAVLAIGLIGGYLLKR